MIFPFESLISFKTAFNLSSNSPRYLAPAIKAPKSSSNMVLSFKEKGTSPLKILHAKPSTIAVFPTPGSPIKTGLFFVFLERIWITLLISSSLPITGSIFPLATSKVKSLPYLVNTSYFSSGFWSSTLELPLISLIADSTFFFSKFGTFNNWFKTVCLVSKIARIKCSTLINLSS